MKIWEILNEENEGQIITDSGNTSQLMIMKDEKSGDVILVNHENKQLAISQGLMQEDWRFVELKGWERSMINKEYFFISSTGRVRSTKEDSTITDELRYLNINYFNNEEEANKLAKFEFTNRSLMKIASLNNETIDWNNFNQPKFYLEYDNKEGNIEIHETRETRTISTIYFTSKEVAQRALELFMGQLKEIYSN